MQSKWQSVSRDGYFYTYVTNLAQTKVYYNNFTAHLQQQLNAAQRNFRDANPAAKQCGNMRGNIRQINDYYPYGLTWSRPEGDDARMYQNKQWQQNEWGEGRGLEMK